MPAKRARGPPEPWEGLVSTTAAPRPSVKRERKPAPSPHDWVAVGAHAPAQQRVAGRRDAARETRSHRGDDEDGLLCDGLSHGSDENYSTAEEAQRSATGAG